MAKKELTKADSLKRPQTNSFLYQERYTCSFGPEDSAAACQKASHRNSAPQTRGQAAEKRAPPASVVALAGFTVTQLYLWPDVMKLSVRHSAHTDAAGELVHGSSIPEQDVKYNHAPVLSRKVKDWVRSQLLDAQSSQQIMAKHAKSALPRIESGTADRDCYLDPQDIRNLAIRQAQLTWKLHDNEAQSVRLFYQQHSEFVFMYQEERSSQPEQSASQPEQPASQPQAASNGQPASSTQSAQSQLA